MGGDILTTKSVGSPGVLPRGRAGATNTVLGPLYAPGTFLLLSRTVTGVGAADVSAAPILPLEWPSVVEGCPRRLRSGGRRRTILFVAAVGVAGLTAHVSC